MIVLMVACFTPLYQQIFHVQFVFMKNNACLCQKDVEKLECMVHNLWYYFFSPKLYFNQSCFETKVRKKWTCNTIIFHKRQLIVLKIDSLEKCDFLSNLLELLVSWIPG